MILNDLPFHNNFIMNVDGIDYHVIYNIMCIDDVHETQNLEPIIACEIIKMKRADNSNRVSIEGNIYNNYNDDDGDWGFFSDVCLDMTYTSFKELNECVAVLNAFVNHLKQNEIFKNIY